MRSYRVFTSSWSRLVSVLSLVVSLVACASPSGGDGGGMAVVPPGSDGGSSGGASACDVGDSCSASGNGVSWNCKTRFMYGTNYAWRSFGADFGGVAAFGNPGIDANPAPFSDAMRQMRSAGVSVIRWWMFPRFLTDSIQWDSDGGPSGITQRLVADVQRALALAEQNDVYIMLTPFSFDNFKPTQTEYGVYSRGLRPIVVDANLRAKLVNNVLGPVADAVAASPYRHRMIAWDVMNEPEWAMTGPSLTGDPDFPAQGGLELVTHAEMETFLREASDVLRTRSGALVSVGGAAIKWAKAWSRLNLDFYQFHYYDWVYENFPFTTDSLVAHGVTDKPVVMGEFPSDGLSAVPSKGLPALSSAQFASALRDHGYAGALSWAFNDASFPLDYGSTKSFADANGCGVTF